MADILPPAPVDAPFGSYNWADWYRKVRDAINNAETISWTQIVDRPTTLAGYGITDAVTTSSGVYTPTLTNVTNIAASTAYPSQWMRVGSVVTVSGQVDIDLTSNGAYELGVSLPIASDFTNAYQCGGVAGGTVPTVDPLVIRADVTNNRAQFIGSDTDKTNHPHVFTFTYRIV
jgi:hypothetical protein